MKRTHYINLDSLHIVAAELEDTLNLAIDAWNAYQKDTNDQTHLKSALHCIEQARGAIQLVGIPGLEILSTELLGLSAGFIDSDKQPSAAVLSAVASGLALSRRYLSFVRSTGQGQPVLLIPGINEARSFAAKPRVGEHAFSVLSSTLESGAQLFDADSAGELDVEKTSRTARRLRQMYQTGLIALIRDNDPSVHLGLMQRACERMSSLCKPMLISDRWLLSAGIVTALADRQLQFTSSRKRWLMGVDRGFRSTIQSIGSSDQQPLTGESLHEMLYMVALIKTPPPYLQSLVHKYEIQTTDDEALLSEERAFVYGLDNGLAKDRLDRLSDTLASVSEYLDLASRQGQYTESDLQKLAGQIDSLLHDLGDTAGEALMQQLSQRKAEVEAWIADPSRVSWDGLMPLADDLIALDVALDRAKIGVIKQREAFQTSVDGSELESAEFAVITEAQASLNLAKRAITSFVESGYDRAHLANLATTLDSVRGGLRLMGLKRACDILARATRFIEGAAADESSAKDAVLDTLADALISLEYYLAQLHVRRDGDDKVLDVADESLAEIGFPANAA